MLSSIQAVALSILALVSIVLGEMSFHSPFLMELLRPFFTKGRTGKRARAGAMALIIPLALVYFNHPTGTEIMWLSVLITLSLAYGLSGWVTKDDLSLATRIGRAVSLFAVCCAGVCLYDWHFWPEQATTISTISTSLHDQNEGDNQDEIADTSSLDSDSQYGFLDPSPKNQKMIEEMKNILFRFKAQTLDRPDYYQYLKLKDGFRKETEAVEAQHHCLLAVPEWRCFPKPPMEVPTGKVDIDISAKVVAPQMSESRFWVIH
jgi:hypothetical protein